MSLPPVKGWAQGFYLFIATHRQRITEHSTPITAIQWVSGQLELFHQAISQQQEVT